MIHPRTFLGLLLLAAPLHAQILPDGVRNTQPPGDKPLTPAEALKRITVPEGFRVTLFAGEPDVAQPIAFTFDDRGRMWVVECFSYPDWAKFEGKDRVTIFEDADNDGRFDKRTVFLADGKNLTGIALGFGGVWLCSAPNLVFIPDRDGDDKPDGPPEIKLDGWNYDKVSHNIFNGLVWGPDGWMYGCHGILAESRVGKPGTPDGWRTKLNCGIWRYHPVKETFEVVAHGTTNPWGLDFDEHGEGFFANCVIEHLWHLVPGARYKRMYGQDYNPYSYSLMGPCSDHLHWQGDDWNTTGSDGELQARFGGGHAHCGTMVYLGDNFPAEYRNSVFTANIHGRCINRDTLHTRGSGYVAKHAPDFFHANDPWFRGVAIGYGPDGGVYITDWNDLGECHDADGVYRESGRIYKVIYGAPKPAKKVDISKLPDDELVKLQLHPNDWQVRHARRVLQERAAAGRDMSPVAEQLEGILQDHADPARRLRALWALYAMELYDVGSDLMLREPDEHIRAWEVRLSDWDGQALAGSLAQNETSPLVRLALASSLQRMEEFSRRELAAALAGRAEDRDDPNLPAMIWYGLEPHVAESDSVAILAGDWPTLRPNVVRRMVEATGTADATNLLTYYDDDAESQLAMMNAIVEALRGRSVKPPEGWQETYSQLATSSNPEVRRKAKLLAVAVGDESASRELHRALVDPATPATDRADAIEALVQRKPADLPPVLASLIGDPALAGAAMRGLAAYDLPTTSDSILSNYAKVPAEHKAQAIATLVSRPAWASALLDAVEAGRVPREDVSPFAARQIHELKDSALQKKLAKVWGVVQTTSEDKKRLMDKHKIALTPQVLATADRRNGRAVFTKTCASCHKLFDAGAEIGPNLTGSDRANLDYILLNVIDPSAAVGRDFQLTNVTTTDGRSIAGIVQRETDQAVTLRTTTEEVVISRNQVAAKVAVPVSFMPEGLLATLTDDEVRDLIAYLGSPMQVD